MRVRNPYISWTGDGAPWKVTTMNIGKKVKWRVMSVGEKRDRVIGYVRAHTENEAYSLARAKFGAMGFSYVEMM